MIVDAVCSSVSYANHLLPVWNALDDSERGVLWTPHDAIHDHLGDIPVFGLPVNSRHHPDPHADRLTLCASWSDSERVKWRPVALIEHGVGQRYPGKDKNGYDGHPSNPGGRERENVVLYLCPNSHVAQDNFMVYPEAEVAVVGPCNLDALIADRQVPSGPAGDRERNATSGLTAAVSFHWNNAQSPLSRWAFYDYQDVIPTLSEHFQVIGHSHPRVARFMRRYFNHHGIEYVESLDEVAQRATLYIVDNSSSGYEMAALGMPTVWLNSRRWPRNMTAWPRFYECVPGPQVDTPDDLLPAIHTALADEEPWPTIRRNVMAEVYSGGLDGQASQRAVEAIRSLSSPPTVSSTIRVANS